MTGTRLDLSTLPSFTPADAAGVILARLHPLPPGYIWFPDPKRPGTFRAVVSAEARDFAREQTAQAPHDPAGNFLTDLHIPEIISAVVDVVAPGVAPLIVDPVVRALTGGSAYGDVNPASLSTSLLSAAVGALGVPLPSVLPDLVAAAPKIQSLVENPSPANLVKQLVGNPVSLLDELGALGGQLFNIPVVGPVLQDLNTITQPLSNLIFGNPSSPNDPTVPATQQAESTVGAPGAMTAGGSFYTPPALQIAGPAASSGMGGGVMQGTFGGKRFGFFKTVATRGTRRIRVNPAGVGANGQVIWKAVRRMNPLNIKAARRSLHRISSLEHVVRKVVHITHPGKAQRVHAFPFRHHRGRKKKR